MKRDWHVTFDRGLEPSLSNLRLVREPSVITIALCFSGSLDDCMSLFINQEKQEGMRSTITRKGHNKDTK